MEGVQIKVPLYPSSPTEFNHLFLDPLSISPQESIHDFPRYFTQAHYLSGRHFEAKYFCSSFTVKSSEQINVSNAGAQRRILFIEALSAEQIYSAHLDNPRNSKRFKEQQVSISVTSREIPQLRPLSPCSPSRSEKNHYLLLKDHPFVQKTDF